MKGYKALSMEMKAVNGNGMQYEMGRLYSIEGEVVPCKKGFHYCDSIEELNRYYNIVASRIFEIEAYGEILECENKYAAKKIQLVRELTKQEINDYFKQNQKELMKSKYRHIRQAVAEQGCGLDVLIHDEDWHVRMAVANQGYGLDILINDESWFIRAEVAKQGYGLDILIHDRDWQVRRDIAKQGYGLDILIHDKDCDVRMAVAQRGYGLDTLIYDKDRSVRFVAQEMLKRSKI